MSAPNRWGGGDRLKLSCCAGSVEWLGRDDRVRNWVEGEENCKGDGEKRGKE